MHVPISSFWLFRHYRLPLLLALGCSTLHAANLTWSSTGTSTSGGDGNWTGGTTWWNGSTGVSWTDGDTAIFNAAGNTTVNSAVIVDRITFSNHTDDISIANGSGTITLNSGITATNPFQVGPRTFTISESIALGASQTWEVNNAGSSGVGTANLLVSGNISGSSLGITKTGNGTLTLSGTNNTYSGDTTINAGTLTLANTAQNNTTIRGNILINGGTLKFGVLNSSNQIADTSSVTMTSGSLFVSQADTINTLSVSGGYMNLTGGLNVTNSSSFTGGSLTVGARSLSASLNGPITLGNFTFGWGANSPTGSGIVMGGDISVNAGTTVNFQGAEGWSGFNGRLTFNTNRVIDVGANANMNVQWGIAGTGGFTKNGTGTLTLSGANTYTGATTINVGTLATSGDNRIATNNSVTVNSGGTFALGGNQTLASITGSGAIQLGNYTLTTGASNSTYSGTISGNGGLTKSGAGRFELTGDTSIGGNLVATAGTLVINGANATSAASMTIQSNATLMGSGIISGNATISGTHSPGNSPGVQTFQNNLTYTAGSSVVWELISNTTSGRGTNYDGIDVGGNLVFDGSSNVILDFDLAGSSVDWSDSFWDISKIGKSGWKLFGVTGTITGFENLQIAAGSYPDGASQSLTASRPNASFYLYEGDDGIYLNYAPIPEPSTAVLAALSAIGLLRRKRS